MSPFTATWPEVQTRIDQIKAAQPARHLTNCFAPPAQPSLLTIATDSAIAFASPEHDFYRLYYFSATVGAIARLLAEFPRDRDTVLGYLDKDRNENLCAAFSTAGFGEKAHYQRMKNSKLPLRKTRFEPDFAREDEIQALLDLLAGTFDPMTDHLPELEKLREIVAARQALVSRTEGQITGALVFQQPSSQVNFNFLVNRSGNTLDLVTLKNSFYHLMAQRSISSGFLWVDSRNTGVIKLHQAFGWKFDGLNDWFYTRPAA
jgi:hypothetical protein